MKILTLTTLFLTIFSWAHSQSVVPFTGKLSNNGQNFDGEALFSLAIIDQNGTEHWRHANDATSTISNHVENGRYTILLGGQGMLPLPEELFLTQQNLLLKVSVDLQDGQGLRLIQPHQRISSTTHSLSAEVARRLLPGSVGLDTLSTELRAILDNSVNDYLAPKIIEQPASFGPLVGDNVDFLINVEGENLSYQWSKDGVPLPDQKSQSLKIDNYSPEQADGVYQLEVSNEFGWAKSKSFRVGAFAKFEWAIDLVDSSFREVLPTSENSWTILSDQIVGADKLDLNLTRINSDGEKVWTRNLMQGMSIDARYHDRFDQALLNFTTNEFIYPYSYQGEFLALKFNEDANVISRNSLTISQPTTGQSYPFRFLPPINGDWHERDFYVGHNSILNTEIIVQIDEFGRQVWNETLNSPFVNSLSKTSSGENFLIWQCIWDETSFRIIKTDPKGNIIWERDVDTSTLGASFWHLTPVIMDDGSIHVYGTYADDLPNSYIYKFSSDGEMLGNKVYKDHWFQKAVRVNSHTYMLSHLYPNEGPILMDISSKGEVVRSQKIEGIEGSDAFYIGASIDGSNLLLGYSEGELAKFSLDQGFDGQFADEESSSTGAGNMLSPGTVGLESLSPELRDILDGTLSQHLLPKIIEQPKNITPVEGESVEYSVDVEGSNINYQWYMDGVALPDQTSESLKIASYNPDLNDGVYRLEVSNEFGAVQSQAFSIGVSIYKDWEIIFDDNINDVIPTDDRGWLVAGTTASKDIFLTKVNADGVEVWHKTIEAEGEDDVAGIIEANDGGYMVLASSNSQKSLDKSEGPRGSYDYWLIKTDNSGNILWDKTYGGDDDDEAIFIIKSHDSGFMLGGRSHSNKSGEKSEDNTLEYFEYDFWVVLVDDNGSIIWDRTLGSGGDDWINSAALTDDGGFVITGDTNGPADGNKTQEHIGGAWDFWFIKIDAMGKKVWDVTLGGEESDEWPVINTVDGGFVAIGTSDSYISADVTSPLIGGRDIWMVKVDNNGEKIWDRRFGKTNSTDDYHFPRVVSAGNSLFITSFLDDQDGDTWLVKTDQDGRLITEKRLPYNFRAPKLVLSQDRKEAALFGTTALGANSSGILVKLVVEEEFLQDETSTPIGGAPHDDTHGEDCKHCEIEDGSVTMIKLSDKVLAELKKTITTGMLDQELLDKINASPASNSITKEMLSGDVLNELNNTITMNRLGDDILNEFHDQENLWSELSFGGSGSDILEHILPLDNGGYLLLGSSQSSASGDKTQGNLGSYDIWLVRVDSKGEKVWDKTYGGSASDRASGILPTSDGNYIIAATSSSGAEGDKSEPKIGGSDVWLLKIDAAGNRIWDKTYGGSSSELVNCIIDTKDGNFLIGAQSSSPADGNKSGESQANVFGYPSIDIWLLKVDVDGNKIWDKTYGGSGIERTPVITADQEGNILVGAISNSPADGNKSHPNFGTRYDLWLVKVDGDGNKIWDKTYGGSGNEFPESISLLADGSILIGNRSNSSADGNKSDPCFGSYDLWLVKVDGDGNKIWDKTYGGSGMDADPQVLPASDGGIIIGSRSNSPADGNKRDPGNGSYDAWILKVDADGNIEWDRSFGGNETEFIGGLIQAKGERYIVAGQSGSGVSGSKTTSNQGSYDYWLFKINEFGEIPGMDGSVIKRDSITPLQLNETIRKYLSPELLAQPMYSGISLSGDEVTLIPQIEGKFLEYQWYKDGIAVSGETSPTLNITSYNGTSNDGNYTLEVKNDFGAVETQSIPLRAYTGDKTWHVDNDMRIPAVITTQDGGYILAGDNGSDFWVKKVADDGVRTIWEKTFSGSGKDYCTGIAETSDNGFILAGTSNTSSGGVYQYMAIKIDENGTQIWEKTYGGTSNDTCNGVINAPNDGFLLFGSSESGNNGGKTSFNKGYSDYWIVRIDENGTQIWDKSFGGNDYDFAYSASSTSDGGFAIAGWYHANVANGDISEAPRHDANASFKMPDAWVVKVDENGTKVWDKRFGGDRFDSAHSITSTLDGGFIIAAQSDSNMSGDKSEARISSYGKDYWVLKIDENGSKIWDKTLGGSTGDNRVSKIISLADGGSLSIGSTTSDATGSISQDSLGNWDYWIVKLDENGTKVWDKRYGGIYSERKTTGALKTNGGFWLTGVSNSPAGADKTEPNIPYEDSYWVLEIGADGNK